MEGVGHGAGPQIRHDIGGFPEADKFFLNLFLHPIAVISESLQVTH